MPKYPKIDGPEPQIYTRDHVAEWEQALQILAVTDAVIKKCERCKIPVEASRQECDSLCDFFQRLIAEETGQHSGNSAPLV